MTIVYRAGPSGQSELQTEAEWRAFFAQSGKNHYIGYSTRPGVPGFGTELEHSHYPIGTPQNDDFDVHVFEWMHRTYSIVSIPEADETKAEDAAQLYGLTIIPGSPSLIDSTGKHDFPLQGPNYYMLVNVSGHPVRTNQGP